MADNVDITEGSGKTVATDDVQVDGSHSQGQVQFMKLVDGTLNGTGSVRVNQAAKANALTVAPASDISDATYIGDIKFGEALPANTNTQEIVGDVAENANAAGNPVLIGGRYDSSPRNLGDTDVGAIALATDGAVYIDDGGNTITVDGTVTANLGSTDNTVLDNIQAAVEIMDDWDDANYCNVNINIAGTDCDGGSGAQGAQTLRVILATDDPAVALLTTIDSDTNNIKTAVEALDNAVDGNFLNCNMCLAGNDAVAGEGAIDSNTLRVTIATDDDGVAHLATIAGDTTAIETAIEIIDDWDATHASAAPADGAQVMGAAYSTALPTDVGADADAARLVTDRYGRLCTGLQPQAGTATLDNADTTTAREIVAATASRKIYITSLIISVDTAGNYWLEDGDATAVTGKMYFAANGGCAQTFPEGTPLSTAVVNKALNVKGSTAGNVSVTVTYYLAV